MSEINTSNEGPMAVSKIVDVNNVAKSSVTNDHGENLGRIESLMLDLETGKIAYAVLAIGGFPNRPQLFAVPWELLTFSHHDKKLILNVPRDLLIKSPGYDSLEQVVEKSDFYWLGEVYEYYSHKTEFDQKRAEERNAEVLKAQQKREEIKRVTATSVSGSPQS
jgi:sporulation protein YlmC with PRC-barrel domain